MVKTRSQTGNVAIKKEEEEDCKPSLHLGSVRNTRSSDRIAKRKPSTINHRVFSAQHTKVEEDTDTKSLLQSGSKSLNLGPKPKISQEQINQLISCIVVDNMSIAKASRKVNISTTSGRHYYNVYKNDPYKNIPSAPNPCVQPARLYTPEQIENLIRYISQDKMPVAQASAKANMTYHSACTYYNKYLKDPNHAIPLPIVRPYYTQDQRGKLISYIVNDKMSIVAASKKVKLSVKTGRRYYHKYFKENNNIPVPSHIHYRPRCTQEQIKEVISYIVKDKIAVTAAARKANMSQQSAARHYQQYLKDNNIEPPVPKKYFTKDEINQLIGYIVDDRMTIKAASEKANMNESTGHKHYRQYLKDHKLDLRPQKCTKDQINELIGYIVDDKMTLTAASKKVNMSLDTSRKYYRQYLKEHNLDMHMPIRYTQEQKGELIRYIIDDKMPILAASKKANVSLTTGYRYYQQYLKDRNPDYSIQKVITQEQKSKLIGYIVHDKMSITAASKKANMGYTTANRHYHRYLNNQKRDAST
jgi:transposase